MAGAAAPADTVLVTGAAGFLGSHLVERLVALGHRTRCLVRRADAPLPASPLIERWVVDLDDAESIGRAVDGVHTIYHLAALPAADHDPQRIGAAIITNIVGTLNTLEAARRGGAARIVLVSSSHVYGYTDRLPVPEDAPLAPRSAYAATKVAAEALARAYEAAHGPAVTIVRPANIYGPRQTADTIIPTIVRQSLVDAEVAVRSLRPRRDFVFADDVVDALVLAARLPQAAGRTLNIGSGTAVSIAELAGRILSLCGREQDAPEVPVGDGDRFCLDCGLARSLLGWAPRVTLDDGLRRTVAWWRGRRSDLHGGGAG
ncbi:NAD-dependent epimerase/dehydratase family protein [Azospirillum sp. ST 5-10]|uniref:NAD-dependent epimerase/dehydratase family protein n=1 Tax=unclassified Azospirillum TaxID=2630922 RepID=UPI003F4A4892